MPRYMLFAIKWPLRFLAICLCVFFLGACGPKSVGEDVYVAPPSGAVSAAHDPVQARYPYGGRSLDRSLYHVNSPQYTQALQRNLDTYLRHTYGKEQAPNDYTNLQPRQISPFRQ